MSTLPVTVILTEFKRPYLEEQLQAIRASGPSLVWLVRQDGPQALEHQHPVHMWHGIDRVILVSPNSGVWTRFFLALEAETEYVAIFDDDTIPGPGWLSYALEHATATLVVGVGVVKGRPLDHYDWKLDQRWGWPGWPEKGVSPYTDHPVVDVDWGGHCWVMRTSHLRAVAHAFSKVRRFPDQGEDMAISYAFQACGRGTIALKQDQPEISCSLKGMEYGMDKHRTIALPGAANRRAEMYHYLRNPHGVGMAPIQWRMIQE